MDKDEVLKRSWWTYLDWWKENVKDVSKPPTEDGFWVWYCLDKDKKLTKPNIQGVAE